MIETLQRIFRLPELRAKIVYTLLLLVACRVGGFIPVPGINGELALNYFRQVTGGGQNLFQLVDVFSGGAFSQMTVTALSIVPYISASILIQVLMAVLPGLQREVRENPEIGRRKLTKWTRLFTLVLSVLQAGLFARYALQMNQAVPGIVASRLAETTLFGTPWLFYLIVTVTMTTGTLFLMWMGEQITEKGIGNGTSLIIALGVISSLPSTIGLILKQLNLDSQEPGQLNFSSLVVLCGLFVLVIVATILILQGQRKIPLQYARRIVGRREVQGGGTAYIPLKINYAGVIPVIFASALLMFPATIGQFFGANSWMATITNYLLPGTLLNTVLYVLLIIGFTYFWTATQFRPDQIASDMKRNGAFIPGIRQGQPTQQFLESAMSRVTFIGAMFLAALAILPLIIGQVLGVDRTISYFFGGTALLILVGSVLDTMKQVESHLLMKQYEGFMKKGRLRGT